MTTLDLGPHLLIDPGILENQGFPRTVHQPKRTRTIPLLTNKTVPGARVADFGSTVIRDPVTGHFRIWYLALNPGNNLLVQATATSADGFYWSPPQYLSYLGGNVLGTVIDDGPRPPYPNLRYRSMLRQLTPIVPPLWAADLWYSADGVAWNKGANLVTNPYGESYTIFRDNGGFSLLHRWNVQNFSWIDAEGVRHTNTKHDPWVRTIAYAFSPDGNNFHPSNLVFYPGRGDHGESQFYYVSNIIQRGNLRLGCMGVLRDDLVVSLANIPAGIDPATIYGTGYTTLVWSVDGVNWNRYDGLDPHFFDPASDPTAWDHAMAWITSIVPVGDKVYLYYGGYADGHKVGTDRQIGMVEILTDRFVSRFSSGAIPTILRTVLLDFKAESISINASGKVRFQVVDENNVPIPGYTFADFVTFSGDSLDADMGNSLARLDGRKVRFEFELTNADLYAFYLYGWTV